MHTGTAFVGALGSEDGTMDITVLGDAANTAAHLSSEAGIGEILVSTSASSAMGLNTTTLETRDLSLKGKRETVSVFVVEDYES